MRMLRLIRSVFARWRSDSSTDQFAPQNELERRLYHAQRGDVSTSAVISELKQSQVVALFNGDPTMAKGMRLNAQPLLLNSSDGEPMLAIFTSIERSKIWSQKQTDFSFGMQVPFEWLLRGTVSGVGLVINPGSTVGLEMSPAGVTQLKANAGWA